MKELKEKIIHFSTYRSIFLGFIILSSILIAVACILLFSLFYNSSEKELGNMSTSMLHQTSYVADIVNEQVFGIGNYLINDRVVSNMMFNKKVDRFKEYEVVKFMKNIQINYPYIYSIGIFNEYTDRYINTKGFTREDEGALIDELINQKDRMYISFFPRKVKDIGTDKDINLLTFVLSPGYSSYLPNNGLIIINFDEQYLHNLVDHLKSESSHSLLIIDTEGKIISQTGGKDFLKNIANRPYIEEVLKSNQPSGNFTTVIKDQQSMIAFVKSESLNWYLIGVNHYSDSLFRMKDLKKNVLVVAFCLFLVCIVISILLTNFMYSPMNKLMKKIMSISKSENKPTNINEFQVLDKEFSQLSNKLKFLEPAIAVVEKSYLLHYINGSKVDIESRFNQPLSSAYFIVVLLKMDCFKEYKGMHSSQIHSLIQFSICNIAMELVGKQERIETIIIEEDEVGILGLLNSEYYSPDFLLSLEELQENVQRHFGIGLTVGVGTIVNNSEKIRDSYLTAKTAVNERFTNGGGKIYSYSEDAIIKDITNYRIPNDLDKRIINAINIGNEQEVIDEIRSLIPTLTGVNYHQAVFTLKKLLFTLYKYYENLEYTKQASDLLTDLVFQLPSFEKLADLVGEMETICLAICGELSENSKGKNSEMIERIKEYTQKEYIDPNLSIEILADQVQITPGYLGKMFKTHCNMSFNDYLKDIRLEKARDLLLETNDAANIISNKVGILNTTYFYTLFKKKYGLSPAKYRLANNKSRISNE
ncbi:hypothetical protein J14TS2_20720 [Bacillus sp. J14TS2]|uniref:helix-turn-helix domain-containing protein n=1 Tax=Bacillus sp. J14TS2 TaxID=2807188 RepID=UPI001B1F3BF7|nr:helix-turn-helix domain-containing protein [Bacillus sp. J14TS2]GIN71597.1 hypothetical protein J14TS2_20720 [Bacillus sp. J14TS2]